MGRPHKRYAKGVSCYSSGGDGTVEGPAQAELVDNSAQAERLHALKDGGGCSVSGSVSWGLPHGHARGCGSVPNMA